LKRHDALRANSHKDEGIGSMKRLALLMAVVALALVAVAPAYGQSAATDAYAGKGGGVLGAVNSGGNNNTPSAPAQVAQSSGSSLPFTGLDVGLLAIGGVALVGVGVGLRRFARPLS
jgi:hypothetical protein